MMVRSSRSSDVEHVDVCGAVIGKMQILYDASI
jgi:hypothetical protein